MRVLLITYDLKSKTMDYEPLFSAIKQTGQEWWHYMRTAWLVYTQLTADEVGKHLIQYIDSQGMDYLLVVEIKKPYGGWLPAKAWEWMNSKNYY